MCLMHMQSKSASRAAALLKVGHMAAHETSGLLQGNTQLQLELRWAKLPSLTHQAAQGLGSITAFLPWSHILASKTITTLSSTSSLLQALWRPFPAPCTSRRAGSACNACAPMHWQAPSYSMHHHHHLHTHTCSPAPSQQLWPCPARLTEGLTTGMLLFCPLTQQLMAEGWAKCACSPSQATITASL